MSASARLQLKVVPGARTEGIDGWLGAALKLRVRAAPEKGRANAAVEAMLTRELALPGVDVRIVGGHTQPRKIVEFDGIDATALRTRLDELLARKP